jgi:hypothetical protein
MEQLGEKVPAHEATLTQMNQRLGAIEAMMRDINNRMATVGEMRAWMGLVIAMIVIAVGVILKFG